MAVFIYIIFLGLCFLLNYKKYGYNASSYLWSIYLFGSFVAAYLLFGSDAYQVERIRLDAVIYHCICLYLFFSPVVYFANKYSNTLLSMPNPKGLKLFSYLTIGFGMVAILSVLPKLKTVLTMGGYKDARNLYLRGALYEDGSSGILGYLGTIGGAFSYFALFLFFYYLCFVKGKAKTTALLLMVSVADPLTSLTLAGRGGITRWILVFVFFYLFFKNSLPTQTRKKIIKRILVFAFPMVLVLVGITISRFSGREASILFSVFNYIGQSFIYFSYNFDLFFEPTGYGQKAFPAFFFNSEPVFTSSVYTDYSLNTFSTFIGSIYKDMGFYRTLLLAATIKVWSFFYFRQSVTPTIFPKLIIFIILVQVFVNGYFYYMYSGTTTVRTFILIYLISLIIYYRFAKKKDMIMQSSTPSKLYQYGE